MRRLIRALGFLAICGVTGLILLFAILWPEHRSEITLPAPTGPFAVGRTTYAWVNDAQSDDLAPAPGAKRVVLAWIWYPSAASSSAAPAGYLPPQWQAAVSNQMGVLMGKFLTRDSRMVHVHSSSDPNLSTAERSYPVLIMRAGGGALTTDFTTLAEDAASHGYVVVGFDAPYRSFVVVLPDGRIVTRSPAANPENMPPDGQIPVIDKLLAMWASDTQFVVDQLNRLNTSDPSGRFTGRLDIQRLGMFGHSLGGATGLQFCHDDSRCKAGIDIDGAPYGSVVKDGVKQPFLFLLSDHGDLSTPEARGVLNDIESIYDRIPEGGMLLSIHGANHFSFSDQILLKSHLVIKLLQLFQGGLDARRGLAITTAYVHTFFDVHLKSAPAGQLDKLRHVYPEVQSAKR